MGTCGPAPKGDRGQDHDRHHDDRDEQESIGVNRSVAGGGMRDHQEDRQPDGQQQRPAPLSQAGPVMLDEHPDRQREKQPDHPHRLHEGELTDREGQHGPP